MIAGDQVAVAELAENIGKEKEEMSEEILGDFDDVNLPPPEVCEMAFVPEELCGCDPYAWMKFCQVLSPALPVQVHCMPTVVGSPSSCELFEKAMKMVRSLPQTDNLFAPESARLKFRCSLGGKFIHRNRFSRRQVICCLHGEMTWLLMNPKAGDFLDAVQNANWSGFRSKRFPSKLSIDEMERLKNDVPHEANAQLMKVKAGDVLVFDGMWWHATSYSQPVFNMFITPGCQMEVAIREQNRRNKMKKQRGLELATITLAKCSQLGESWEETIKGEKSDFSCGEMLISDTIDENGNVTTKISPK